MIELDSLHEIISAEILHQSDKDIPRGSVCNSILDETKCQSSERRGNLFRLLCISFTKAGKACLCSAWQKLGISGNEFHFFLKLYLAMEEWFHENNKHTKVLASKRMIANVLRKLKKISPP